MVNGILDCWDSTSNTLVVGDFLIGIEGNIEIYLFNWEHHQLFRYMFEWNVEVADPDQNTLVLEVHVSDGKLIGE